MAEPAADRTGLGTGTGSREHSGLHCVARASRLRYVAQPSRLRVQAASRGDYIGAHRPHYLPAPLAHFIVLFHSATAFSF